MPFYYESKIVELCAQGMNLEGEGKHEEAAQVFTTAWNESSNELEKCISAHYLARHQTSVADKLRWDIISLDCAQKVTEQNSIKGFYPSLYLNIGKGYEDLKDFDNAIKNYQSGLIFSDALSEDGYGNMIRAGILSGLERVMQSKPTNNN